MELLVVDWVPADPTRLLTMVWELLEDDAVADLLVVLIVLVALDLLAELWILLLLLPLLLTVLPELVFVPVLAWLLVVVLVDAA